MRFRLITIVFVLMGFNASAQIYQEETAVKDIIESIADNLPEDYDIIELTDVLNKFRKHPVNLNQTTPEELKMFLFLSLLQIHNLFYYIKQNGKFITSLELQSVDGFDSKTVECLLPFVTVNDDAEYEGLSLKNILNDGQSDLIMRFSQILEKQKGFTDLPGNHYIGSPERFQTRYRYQYGTIASAALTFDKDAGEKFLAKPFDFYSGNVALFKLVRVKKVVIGDYSLQFGQGLTLWSGFAFGKGPDVTSVAKRDLGLRPYNSSNEYSYLRGISATIHLFNNIDVTPFFSFRKLDASQRIGIDGDLVQSTINQTGLHRTETEIKNKNVLGQQLFGAVLQYNKNDLSIGGIAYHSAYSNSFITQTPIYDKFSFTGKSLANFGAFYNYTFKNIYFFGEAGKSSGSGIGFINGALIGLSPIVSAAVTYRSYSKDYHNFFNQALSESSEAVNEKGLYAGLMIIPNKYWSFSAYSDYFHFPWLKYRVDAPSTGYEIFGQAVYTPDKTFKILVRFKTEHKMMNTDLDVPIKFLEEVKKENYRLDLNWRLNQKWNFQNRAEVSQYRKGAAIPEFGYLVYQDVSYAPMFSKITGNLRIAYFNTKSYNSRIYAYEDDVLYSFSFGMYSGKGFRTYLNLKYNLTKKLNIWLRYAVFMYKDVNVIGTYLDEIQGNKKSEVKIQLRYQF